MIEGVDNSLGRILEHLEESGIAENTLVCLVSDNGGLDPVTRQDPLRGGKGMLYEGGIRVPMIVRWPARVRPGSRCDEPVIGVDIYPTLMQATGALPPREYEIEGKSLMPLLTERGSLERDAIFWHFPAYLQSNKGAAKAFRTKPCGAMRQGRYKLIEFFETRRMELYDLIDDVGETNNLAKTMPDKAKKLRAKLRKWRGERKAPVPMEPNPGYKPG